MLWTCFAIIHGVGGVGVCLASPLGASWGGGGGVGCGGGGGGGGGVWGGCGGGWGGCFSFLIDLL